MENSNMRVAGVELEMGKMSITGLLACIMAFIAMVGGWYKFDARVGQAETSIGYLQKARESDETSRKTLSDAILQLDVTVGKLNQRLDDADRSNRDAGYAADAARAVRPPR